MRRLLYDLVDQFMISQSPEHVPQGWRVRVDGCWVLASHPRLPVIEIHAWTGSHVGWLLGYPIDQAGHLLTSSWLIIANVDPGALTGLDRVRCLIRILYRGITGYRVKPPKGFGKNMMTVKQLCDLLGKSGFEVVSTQTIKDTSRSSNIPVEYVRAVKV